MDAQSKNLLKKAFKFIGFVFLTELTGVLGSLFTKPAIGSWYASLQKPSFNPPAWVFAPVWIVLFLLMAAAAFIFSETTVSDQSFRKNTMLLFYFHLFLNFAWNVIFFGLNMILVAVVEIGILLMLIIAVTRRFYKVNKISGYLMLPYILWVAFATILTMAIFIMN